MKKINMHEAKSTLSKVIEKVDREGEVYLICRNGKPVAELRAYTPVQDILRTDPGLSVEFHEDASLPLEPEDWPDAFD
ncbi:MAG: type II toxin-antitoxin system Phd/YefM family antitoxin [Acidobacteriota bacterium]